jgi:hypothetical protein
MVSILALHQGKVMNEYHYLCFFLGAYSGLVLPGIVHEFYEWAIDEVIAWRLCRNIRKLYWFLPWKELRGTKGLITCFRKKR